MSYVRQNPFPRKLNWPFTINRSSPQAYGLVNWWPGSGYGHFLEDLGPGQRHMELKGTAAESMWSPGVPGSVSGNTSVAGVVTGSGIVGAGIATGRGALNMDGSTNYATNPSTALPSQSFITVTAWVLPTSGAPAMQVVCKDNIGTMRDFEFSITAAATPAASIWNQANTLGNFVGGNTNLKSGVWNHVAWTWDGVTIRDYVDGVLDSGNLALAGTSIRNQGAVMEIGRTQQGGSFFNGQLEDIRIYNRALTRPEIYRIWHPDTRWDLRKPLPSVRRYFMFEPKVNPGIGAFQPVTASQTFDSWMPYADEI